MSYLHTGSFLAVGITFTVTSIAAVAARFATRLHYDRLSKDDWTAFIAMWLVLGACAVMITGYATDTLGSHTPPIGPAIFTLEDPSQQLSKKLEFAFYFIQVPALLTLKLSTLLFYKRLFRGRGFNIAFWCLTIISVLWALSFFISYAAGCIHFEDRFTSLLTISTKCTNLFILLLCQCITDVAVDLGILILPIPIIIQLKMPIRQKVAVCTILVIGSLAITCGLYRMVLSIQVLTIPLLEKSTLAGMRTDDFKGIVSVFLLWSMLELGVGMVAICLPTLRPLLKARIVDSVANSLRSIVRRGSRTTDSEAAPQHGRSDESSMESTERVYDYPGKRGSSSATACFDPALESGNLKHEYDASDAGKNKIIVQKTVQLTTE